MGAKTGKHSKSPHSSPRDGATAVAGGEKPAPQIAPTTTFNISVFGEPNCGKSVMTYTFAKVRFNLWFRRLLGESPAKRHGQTVFCCTTRAKHPKLVLTLKARNLIPFKRVESLSM
jgi:hypothetical protein